MAKGKELKGRIRSTENPRKITRTMEMVATSKLKRATDRVASARPYAQALSAVLSHVHSHELADRFPLLRQPAAPRRVVLLLLTANRGLCGAFNAHLIKEARNRIDEFEKQGLSVELHVVGRKGAGFFRYINRPMASTRTDITDKPSAADAASLIDALMQRFADGELDAVHVTYANYRSALSTPPVTDQVLPVLAPATATGTQSAQAVQHDFILAPSAEAILEALLPLYVRNAVYRALVETEAGFQSAQRTAMKNATDNATDLLQELRRTYNSARQAQITQEIAEIVGGASALQG